MLSIWRSKSCLNSIQCSFSEYAMGPLSKLEDSLTDRSDKIRYVQGEYRTYYHCFYDTSLFYIICGVITWMKLHSLYAFQIYGSLRLFWQVPWLPFYWLSLGACAMVTVVVLWVSEWVCVSVTALVATYLLYMSKVRQYTVSCRLLNICIVWTSLKTFCSGDMASFACHDDRRLSSFSIKTHQCFLTQL